MQQGIVTIVSKPCFQFHTELISHNYWHHQRILKAGKADDIYSKVSCDSTSNFIYLDLNGFMPERYYRLELKVKAGIVEDYITDQIYFKVTR
jgi:hypothetical protein